MTNHMKTRKSLKEIKTINEFESLLQKYILTEDEKKILRMYYVNGKSFAYIGDIMGYSESGVKYKHNQILKKLSGFDTEPDNTDIP